MTKYSPLRNKFEYLNKPKPNTRNLENFPAWNQPLEAQYTQLLTSEMFGNTYYAKEEDRLKLGVKVIADFVAENPTRAAEIAIVARKDYYMRTMPILATVFISTTKYEGFPALFKAVIWTPRDAIQFIDLCRSGVARKGLGRKIKKAFEGLIGMWMEKKGGFYATKYKNQIQTITKLVHPKIDSTPLDYIMEKEGIEWLPATIAALKEIKSGELSESQVIDRIVKHRLDWNALKGVMKPSAAMWKTFLNNMSAIALIKNVATAERHLLADEVLDILRKRLTVEFLQKGHVLPIRLMQAYKMADVQDTKRYLGMIANDYARQYDLSNLGLVAICPDISGSMTGMANKRFSYAEMAGMFAGVLAKACKNSVMLPWATSVFRAPQNSQEWRDVVYMYDYCRKANGGGTAMYMPIEYLLVNNIKVDTFVLLTDTEEWVRSNWFDYWLRYLQKVNRNAKAFLIRSDSYINSQPYPPETAVKYNIYQMYGYSDHAFKLLSQI